MSETKKIGIIYLELMAGRTKNGISRRVIVARTMSGAFLFSSETAQRGTHCAIREQAEKFNALADRRIDLEQLVFAGRYETSVKEYNYWLKKSPSLYWYDGE